MKNIALIVFVSSLTTLFWIGLFRLSPSPVSSQSASAPADSETEALVSSEPAAAMNPRLKPKLAACESEILRFCPEVQAERQAYVCLFDHEEELSSACQAIADEFKRPLLAVCGEDLEKHCKGVKFGGSRIRNCLLLKSGELSKSCRDAFVGMAAQP